MVAAAEGWMQGHDTVATELGFCFVTDRSRPVLSAKLFHVSVRDCASCEVCSTVCTMQCEYFNDNNQDDKVGVASAT